MLDVAIAFSNDPDRWWFVLDRIRENATIFWGYGVRDAGILEVLARDRAVDRPSRDRWIVVPPADATTANIKYFRSMGFHVITGDTAEVLDYLNEHSSEYSRSEAKQISSSLVSSFPEFSIPSRDAVVVRPVLDFYLGSPPQWSDIFSGQLYRTSHFADVADAIASGRDVVVVGVPACGKTTLMMQLAAEIDYEGHKLACDELTVQKARLLTNKLGRDRALVLIDNFTDSIDAFRHLCGQSTIQVVGFDRDYNYLLASHRAPSGLQVINVTELSDADIQGVLAQIPDTIRHRHGKGIATEEGVQPSLFEIIEANTTKATLKARYRSVVSQLMRDDPVQLSILLMCCYVHSCRTPVSMDMLLAFLRGKIADYNEVYDRLHNLGRMLSDYAGPLVEEEQDYFVPRSAHLSEAVIHEAPIAALSAMLKRFHTNVTPYRTCRYDVFRRRAYDADIMVRAFPRWTEGYEFYMTLYERDSSPYLLQQAALYLSRKKRHQEAFRVIDKAVTLSGGLVWSIRNSHAIVLFNANIDHPNPDDPTVRATLKRSMDILSECYRWDKRRAFHARVFAEQALRYSDIYADPSARTYLQTAEQWLASEIRRSPWHREVRRLLPKVTKRLRSLGD